MSTELAVIPREEIEGADSDFIRLLNENYTLWHDSQQDGLKHAITVGLMLLEAKPLIGHGAWKPWINERFAGSYSTAQRAMQVAQIYKTDPDSLRDIDGQLPATITGVLSAAKRQKATANGSILSVIPGGDEPSSAPEKTYRLTLPQLTALAQKRWHRAPKEKDVLAFLKDMGVAA